MHFEDDFDQKKMVILFLLTQIQFFELGGSDYHPAFYMPRRHQGESVPGRSLSNEATDDHHTAPNPAPPEEFQPPG